MRDQLLQVSVVAALMTWSSLPTGLPEGADVASIYPSGQRWLATVRVVGRSYERAL